MEAAAKEMANLPGNSTLCPTFKLGSSSKLSHPPVRFRIKMPSPCSTSPLVMDANVNENDGICCSNTCEAGLCLEPEAEPEPELVSNFATGTSQTAAGEEFGICTTNSNGATLEDYEAYQVIDYDVGMSKKESSGDSSSSHLEEQWLGLLQTTKSTSEEKEVPRHMTEDARTFNDNGGHGLPTVVPAKLPNNITGSWKRNRSARKDGGAKKWENASCEVLQPAIGKASVNSFSPGSLVWGKLSGGLWWPAEVIKVEDVPPGKSKQKRGDCIPVRFLHLQESEGSQSIFLLDPGSVFLYTERKEEFIKQNISASKDVIKFEAALMEANTLYDKQITEVTKSSSARSRADSTRQGNKGTSVVFRHKLRGKQEVGKEDLKLSKDREPTRTRKRKRESTDVKNRKGIALLGVPGESLADVHRQLPSSKKRRLAAAHRERSSDKESGGRNDSVYHDSVLQEKTRGDDGYFFECVVCDIGGNLLCCDKCPRTYHLECLDPPLKRTPPGKWHCPACREHSGAGKIPARMASEMRRSRASRRIEDSQTVSSHQKEPSKHHRKGEKAERYVAMPQMPRKRKENLKKRESKKTRLDDGEFERTQVASTKCSQCGADAQNSKVSVKDSSLCKQCCKLGSIETGSSHVKEHEKDVASEKQVEETLKEQPSTCTKPEEENSKEKDEVQLWNTLSVSLEVDRIFGCRVGCTAESSDTTDKDILKEEVLRSKISLEDHAMVAAETKPLPALHSSAMESSLELDSGVEQERNLVSGKRKQHSQAGTESVVDACEGSSASCMDTVVSTVCGKEEVLSNGNLKVKPKENLVECGNEEGVLDSKGDFSAQLDRQPSQNEMEYLVKWVGRSHVHNEWVRESKLRLLSKRKLDNYKFKYGTFPIVLVNEKWSRPQCVLGRRNGVHGLAEVLVKWCGLPYDECTWERVDEPAICNCPELLKRFDDFETAALKKASTSVETEGSVSLDYQRSSEMETLVEQPKDLKGGSLFPHQMEALNWLRKCWSRKRNVILADEMGLGKTISASAFISSLYQEFKVKTPCLVLVPLSTMPNWMAEFSAWTPHLNVIEYHGSGKARATIRQYEWHAAGSSSSKKSQKAYKFNVMLTTYEMVIADASQLRAVPWELLIVDEGHRLKNTGSKLFHLLNTFSFSHRVLLTGTPLQNNAGEMYNLLNFLQPDAFPSLLAFEEKFKCLSTAEQVEELKKLVAPHMLRRLKKDAMQNIPPKTERVVPVQLSSVQAEYYRALLTRNYQVLRQAGKTNQHKSMLNIVVQLRKVCNHPYLIPGTEPEAGSPAFLHEMRIKASAKLMLLHAMLKGLREQGHRVLIFSQMTKLLDILEDYLTVEFGNQAYERVDGSVSVTERQAAINRFNQDTSRFVFLLSTRACGLGINLATADTVVIYDSDFNPHADIQAMNRAHRIGQSNWLLVYRLVVRASVEERILQLAKKKLMLDHLFANKSGSQKEVEDILKWGTEELFQDCSGSGEGASNTPRMEVMEGLDESDGKQRKKVGGLGDVYEDTCHKAGRSKILWDDAAVARLLDRSDLSTEVTEGEAESDLLGSLKAWDWNEQDTTEEQEPIECFVKEKDAGSPMDAKAIVIEQGIEEESNWDKILRKRWETLQIEEEAALGRGKRMRKTVSYKENFNPVAAEVSNESGNDDDDDPEPEYTPAGRALKNKLAKLRARQKERIASRCKEVEWSFGLIENRHVGDATTEGNQVKPPVCSPKPWSIQESFLELDSSYFNSSPKLSDSAVQASSTLLATTTNQSIQGDCLSNQLSSSSSLLSVSHSLPNFACGNLTSSGQGWKHFFTTLPPSLVKTQQSVSEELASLNGTTSMRGNLSSALNQSSLDLQPKSFPSEKQISCNSGQIQNPGNVTSSESCRLPMVQEQLVTGLVTNPESTATTIETGIQHIDVPVSLDQIRGGGAVDTIGQSNAKLSGVLMVEEASSCTKQTSIPHSLSPNLTISLGLGVSCGTSLDLSSDLNSLRNAGNSRKSLLMSTFSVGHSNFSQVSERTNSFPDSATGCTAKYEKEFARGLSMLGSSSIRRQDENQAKTYPNLTFFGGMGGSAHAVEDPASWTEEELDALWSGVRRHGRGNWVSMLQDPRLCFSRFRTAKDLADRWSLEQLKMLGGPFDWSDNTINRENSRSLFSSVSDGLQAPLMHRDKFFGTGRVKSSSNTAVFSQTRELLMSKIDLESASFRGSRDDKACLIGSSQNGIEARSRLTHMGTISNVVMATSRDDEIARLDLGRKIEPYRSANQGLPPPVFSPDKQGDDHFMSHRFGDKVGSIPQTNFHCTPFSFNKSFPDPMATGSLPRCTLGEGEWNFSNLQLRFGKGATSTDLETIELPNLQNFPDKLSQRLPDLQGFTGNLNLAAMDVSMKVSENRTGIPQYVGPSDVRGLLQNVTTHASLDKRKMKAGQSTVRIPSTAAEEVSTKSTFSSNLPHWLREAFKAPAPSQPALPSTIAAVSQAIDLVYRDTKSTFPVWINPGPPPVPPHRKTKRRKKKKGVRLGCRILGEAYAGNRGHLGNAMLPNLALMGKQNQTSCFPVPGLSLLDCSRLVDGSFPSLEGRHSSTLLNVPPCTSFQWTVGQAIDRLDSNSTPIASDLSPQIPNIGNQLLLASPPSENFQIASLKAPIVSFDQFVSSGLAHDSLVSQGRKTLNSQDQSILQQHWPLFPSGNKDSLHIWPQTKSLQPQLSQQLRSDLRAASTDLVSGKVRSTSAESEDSSSKTHSDPCIRNSGREMSNNEDASSEQTISDDRNIRH